MSDYLSTQLKQQVDDEERLLRTTAINRLEGQFQNGEYTGLEAATILEFELLNLLHSRGW